MVQKAIIKGYITQKFGWQAPLAIAVFTAESGLRKDAVGHNTNGTLDVGIAQINTVHCGKVGDNCIEKLKSPKTNIDVAYQIYKSSGFYPWVVFQKGTYKNYL